MKLLIIAVLFSIAASAQKPDTLKAKDSTALYLAYGEMLQFMQKENLGVKDYILVQNVLTAYIREKQISWKKK